MVVAEMEQRYGDGLRLVYRHFPLRSVHPHAEAASLAAEAAGRQGKFWEMHDALGHARKPLTPETIRAGAKSLGLDLDRYDADLADPALKRHIKDDFEGGIASGVNGTPTFFINNVRYDDDFNDEELGDALEAARRVAAQAGASGVE